MFDVFATQTQELASGDSCYFDITSFFYTSSLRKPPFFKLLLGELNLSFNPSNKLLSTKCIKALCYPLMDYKDNPLP